MNARRGMVVAGAVAGLLAYTGHLVVGVVLVLVATVGGQVVELSPGLNRRVSAASRWLGAAVGAVLLAIVTALVLTPVWLITRLLRWDPMAPDRARAGDWRNRPRAVAGRRTFARESGAATLLSRAHGVVVGLVVIALLAVPAVIVVRREWRSSTPRAATVLEQAGPAGGGPAADPPQPGELIHSLVAHDGDAWAADLFREEAGLRQTYDPYLVFVPNDYAGEHINVTDQERASYVPTDLGPDPVDVWFFGSSALFGIGQRDEHTIPSEVVRLAEADGVPVRAHNFGMSAYVNWQETLLFAQLLTERENPDLVVFYDGANDVATYAFSEEPVRPTAYLADDIGELVAEAAIADVPGQADEPSARRFADPYHRGVALARDLGQANGFEVVHFFQPSFGTKELQDHDQALLDELGWDRDLFAADAERWDEVAEELRDPVIPLLDVLDDAPELVYFDQVHTDETGARIVAEAVYAELRAELERLAG